MYPTSQNITTQSAKDLASLYDKLYGNTLYNTGVKKIEKSIEEQKTSAKYTIASNIAGIIEAQAGVEAIKASKSQYEANKSLINRNIDTTQTIMMQNFQDSMAQLDAVAAAKNVDINSQSIRGIKERGLMEMGQDFADMTIQGSLQKAALDLQYTMEKSQAESIRNKSLTKGFDNILKAAEYLL